MKMKNREKNLGNRGLTLVELLIVIAIMVILTGGVLSGFGILHNGRVKEAAYGINDYILELRMKSMSVAADGFNLSIKKGTDGYALELNKKEGEDEVLIKSLELSPQVVADFNDIEIENAVITMDKSTGAVKTITINDEEVDLTAGLESGKFKFVSGGRERSLTLYYNTGKTEIE